MQRIRFHRQPDIAFALIVLLAFCSSGSAQSSDLELSRTARPWEFFCATGMRAGLFGNESGNLEAWVYPLKIFRNFHLHFLTEGRSLPAESLVRTVSVRPESSVIVYTGDTFSVTETLAVPVHEAGAVITFEVETAHPLEIEAEFERDFQLEWPAALGGTYLNWDAGLHAFYFGEEQKKYSAIVGSPSGDLSELEYQTNYSASQESAIRLCQPGHQVGPAGIEQFRTLATGRSVNTDIGVERHSTSARAVTTDHYLLHAGHRAQIVNAGGGFDYSVIGAVVVSVGHDPQGPITPLGEFSGPLTITIARSRIGVHDRYARLGTRLIRLEKQSIQVFSAKLYEGRMVAIGVPGSRNWTGKAGRLRRHRELSREANQPSR